MNSPLKNIFGFIISTFEQVVFALAIFMILYLFFLQPHQVRGRSMEPNFQDNEYLLTDKISYRLTNPKRGDVIVFAAPPDRREDFIKRIIGLPGETIAIENGHILIGGTKLDESYIPPDIQTLSGTALAEGQSLLLAKGEYFVLGDNRYHSSDSRSWGVIKKDDIVGRAWIVYWPPAQIRILPTYSFAGL